MFQIILIAFSALHLVICAPMKITTNDVLLKNISEPIVSIMNATEQFTNELRSLHNDYLNLVGVTKISPQIIQSMIGSVKSQKHKIHSIKVEMNTVSIKLNSYEIQERSKLEYLRIMLKNYEQVLNKIAMNVLGASSEITTISNERLSDELNTAIALESNRFEDLGKKIKKIDADLHIIRDNSQNESGKKTLKVTLDELNEIIKESELIRVQLSQAYLADSETTIVQGMNINMIQEAQMDTLLTALVWFENYCKNYKELMQTILESQ